MSSDLELFCKAMDGVWEVIAVTREGNRITVTYQSVSIPLVTWQHRPFHPEIVPSVGDRGRIGFISSPKRVSDE